MKNIALLAAAGFIALTGAVQAKDATSLTFPECQSSTSEIGAGCQAQELSARRM